ncbi:MAG: glycosyltransferase family 39 protein, partial [Candidatus Omnitrophica bacterium]|nr:glycosyltransferase family 39 protein [Candidatus Omnitrophota bacterium]
MNILKRKISKHSVVIGLIIAAGFLLRFRQYFYNKSLWLDEASLALNIIHRPWWQLFKPLDYLQGAPVGFLLIEKFFIYLFGSGEYVLRLFPFISALAALFLFFNVARFLLDRDALVLAMTLMSFSGVLIYYSSECKQYSSDVFLALIVLNIFLRPYRPMISVVRALALGLMCAVFIFISHPIFFVLLGIAVVNVGSCIREKKWLTMAGLLSV